MLDKRLLDLESFLKDKYSDEQCHLIISSILSMKKNYNKSNGLNNVDYDKFERKYIDLIKKSQIVFLDDINKDPYVENYLYKTDENYKGIGYIKDKDNRYVNSKDKPTYNLLINGYVEIEKKRITIYYDEVSKQRRSINDFQQTIIHELTHLNQKGFGLPHFVLCRDQFLKTLMEGNAKKNSNYTRIIMPGYYTIPNFEKNNPSLKDNLEYNIYKYLYFKLEILLGNDFMEEWATTKNDESFIIKSIKIMDSKYGIGFSNNFYKYFLLLLLDKNKYSKDNQKEILDEQNKQLLLLQKSNKNLKNSLVNNKEINREKLNSNLLKLKNKKFMYSNIKEIEGLFYSSINACQEIIDNPNYYKEALNNMELLMIDSLLVDLDKKDHHSKTKARYYLDSVESEYFDKLLVSDLETKYNKLIDYINYNKIDTDYKVK